MPPIRKASKASASIDESTMPVVRGADESPYNPESDKLEIEQGKQTVIEKVVNIVRIHPDPNHPKIIWLVPKSCQKLSPGDTVYVKGFGGAVVGTEISFRGRYVGIALRIRYPYGEKKREVLYCWILAQHFKLDEANGIQSYCSIFFYPSFRPQPLQTDSLPSHVI
ncbi:hypothetical protein Hypma_004542 [Hypsizygus marmoreus]|uniref:Uncharacterized protein n=1 Tax=Hypsizygus marmoreus TaxID=39966 RepID=A0A369J2N7_HYPMA|nr:hypothetical protein Hypma_004542 [Hypsizygus marmoreus]